MTRPPRRKPDTHKGDYGTVLIVAGSPGMAGAAVLAGEAAYRAGAGLVVYCCPERIADVVSIKQTCGVVRPFGEKDAAAQILEEAARSTSAVLGPGLSRAPAVQEAVREAVQALQIPFVLDADGLNAFQEYPELLQRGKAPRVLTPHPGEASRLLKMPAAEIQADRAAAATELAKRFLAVAVLKGHRTVVTDGARSFVNRTGNPGMATGGSGDVLAGVIGALLGQKVAPLEAARMGVEVHGRAGDLGARELGETSLLATDILDYLPKALKGKR
jgi:NAD(P)H-hydrate epimerase